MERPKFKKKHSFLSRAAEIESCKSPRRTIDSASEEEKSPVVQKHFLGKHKHVPQTTDQCLDKGLQIMKDFFK